LHQVISKFTKANNLSSGFLRTWVGLYKSSRSK
jgi:hypothetical protein